MIKIRRKFQKVNICGTDIDNVSMDEALMTIEQYIRNRSCEYIVTPNVDHLIKLQNDNEFQQIYNESSMRIPDGMPLIWASRYLKTPLRQKVSGSDLVIEICKVSAMKGYRLFFLGGEPPAAQLAKERLEQQYRNLKICGVYAPSFGFEHDAEENQKILRMIRESKPDILLVGLGAPKQEKWINKYYKELEVPVSIGVGITFGFISGMVKRAPLWMQRCGLEWFWRLLREPKRLWKRYLVDDVKIFWLVYQQKKNLFPHRRFQMIHNEAGSLNYTGGVRGIFTKNVNRFMSLKPLWLRRRLYAKLYEKKTGDFLYLFNNAPLEHVPKIKMRLSPDDLGHQIIAFTGYFEINIVKRVKELVPKDGGLLVDVGANYGYFSCLWAGLHVKNLVLAFEPSPRCVKGIETNIKKNKLLSQIRLIKKALSNQTGFQAFTLGSEKETGWGGLVLEKDELTVKVRTVRLDDEIAKLKTHNFIDVLKIDTEGADLWVLEGAEKLLRNKQIKHIFYEENLPRMKKLNIKPGEIKRYLESFGYKVKMINFISPNLSDWYAQR